ncbi:hypothetical protein ACO0M4_06975 [Streptomyces sp. RGM 3693]|uniref:hypothetical protein n=1 Tax=Streptomyces sp. RGM 3693 TaxID=3413284 RepID=UPI003D2697C1
MAAAHADDRILGWRWWSRDELADAHEALWPPQQPALLTPLHGRGGEPGADPVLRDLGYLPNSPPRHG